MVLNDGSEELDRKNVSSSDIQDWFHQDDSFITLPYIPKNSQLIAEVTKLNDNYSSLVINPVEEINQKKTQIENCDNFRKQYFSYFIKDDQRQKLLELSAQNAASCISFYLQTLDHDQGYYITIENQNIQGQPLHLWVLNEDEKTPLVDTYLQKSKKAVESVLVLPPMEKFGKAYSLHLENASIGNAKVGNLIGKITINPIPYYFISDLRLESQTQNAPVVTNAKLTTSHPNQSLYLVSTKSQGQSVISLSQAYDKNWVMYRVDKFNLFNKVFPFFGRIQNNHILLDNWKNGWVVSQGDYVIIYWPQYLEYLGLALTGITLITLAGLALKKHKKAPHTLDQTNNL